jgi:hypothetical protein
MAGISNEWPEKPVWEFHLASEKPPSLQQFSMPLAPDTITYIGGPPKLTAGFIVKSI